MRTIQRRFCAGMGTKFSGKKIKAPAIKEMRPADLLPFALPGSLILGRQFNARRPGDGGLVSRVAQLKPIGFGLTPGLTDR